MCINWYIYSNLLSILIALFLLAISVVGSHFIIEEIMDRLRKKARGGLDEKIKEIQKIIDDKKKESDDEFKEKIIAELRKKIFDREIEKEMLFQTDHEKWVSKWIGIFERTMYITFWFIGHPELIGAWLVVKIVGDWLSRDSGRIDRFLIRTGLSVWIAVIVSWLIEKLVV